MSAQAAKQSLWKAQQDHVGMASRPDRPETVAGADAASSRTSALLRPWTLADGAEAKAERVARRAGECGGWPAGEVDRVLDILGLLLEPEAEPAAEPEPVPLEPKAADGPSGPALRRAARLAKFRRLLQVEGLEVEEARAVIGVSPETARAYLKDIRDEDERREYFEARALDFGPRDAGVLAGLPEGGWREHEGAWQAHLAAEATS